MNFNRNSHIEDEDDSDILTLTSPLHPPVSHVRRALVLCLDGTYTECGMESSNVLELFRLLDKGNPDQQVVYYQPRLRKPGGRKQETKLEDAVIGAYEFLMEHYHDSDSIYILGFAQGAHVAGILCEMIQKVGLLPSGSQHQAPYAYSLSTRDDKEASELCRHFKDSFSFNVIITFVGVWEVPQILEKRLPASTFAYPNSAINRIRRALPLNDHKSTSSPFKKLRRLLKRPLEAPYVEKRPISFHGDIHGDLLDVWFVGCPEEMSGRSKFNKRRSLSRISLRWMISEILKCDSGILFDPIKLRGIGVDLGDVERLRPVFQERNSIYDFDEDQTDVLAPICVQRARICIAEFPLLSRWLQIPLSVVCFPYACLPGKDVDPVRVAYDQANADRITHPSIYARAETSSRLDIR